MLSSSSLRKKWRHSSSLLTVSMTEYLLSSGRISREELVLYCRNLAVAGEEIWNLNAFTKIYSLEECTKQMNDKESNIVLPISVKANIAVEDSPLTASSRILPDTRNIGYNADVVQRFRDNNTNNSIIIGITQMDEFGMGSLGTNLGEISNNEKSKEGEEKDTEKEEDLFTKNPLSFLKYDNNNNNKTIDDWIKEIQKPYDCIMEEHHTILKRKEEEEGDNSSFLLTGGSSCGSAASVLHGSSLVSIGSDTGGSIRLPAAWCGITGFKPLYGSISRHGLVSYASSLDTIGLLAPTAECIASVLPQLLLLVDDDDSNNSIITDSTARCYQKNINTTTTTDDSSIAITDPPEKEIKKLRVGIPSAFVVDECPASILEAWSKMATMLEEKLNCEVRTIDTDILSPELVRLSLPAYYIIASAEASSNLSRYNGFTIGNNNKSTESSLYTKTNSTELERSFASSRTAGFGSEVVRRILAGTYVLSSDTTFHTHYESAMKIRAKVHQQLLSALSSTSDDVLLVPTCLSPVPPTNRSKEDPTAVFVNDVFTVPISLAGLPAISIPYHDNNNSTIGLQIVGTTNEQVLRVAQMIQQIM